MFFDQRFLQILKEITDEKADIILKFYNLENKGKPVKIETLINLEPQTVELAKEYDIPLYLVRNNTINKNNAPVKSLYFMGAYCLCTLKIK